MAEPKTVLPNESAARKAIPMATGLLDYFPAALAAVAEVSQKGNDKHNPGEPLHWSRGKSGDHADCIVRHLTDRGTIDPEDGLRHSAKIAWRALALLQEELEAAGAPLPRGAWMSADPLVGQVCTVPLRPRYVCSRGCGSSEKWGGGLPENGDDPVGYPCNTQGCKGRLVPA